MQPSCAQETLLHVRILRVRRSLDSAQIQQDQRLLVIRIALLVMIFLISRDRYRLSRQAAPQLLCSGPSMCPSPSKRPDRPIDVDRGF